jgi:hypothetical protein
MVSEREENPLIEVVSKSEEDSPLERPHRHTHLYPAKNKV